MATTYYVRTLNCVFPTINSSCEDNLKILKYNRRESGNFDYLRTITSTGNLYSTFDGKIPWQIPMIADGSTPGYPPTYPYDHALTWVPLQSFNNGDLLVYSPFNLSGIESSVWVSSGWSIDNIKTELCSFVEEIKSTPISLYDPDYKDFGNDNGEINLNFFVITFTDEPGKTYYAHAFYQGNDPLAQETIVI